MLARTQSLLISLLATGLLAASCSNGGSSGGNGPIDPRVLALEGTWNLALAASARQQDGGCLPIGLSSAPLRLELIGGVEKEGASVGGYRVRGSQIDTASPVNAEDSTLELHALSANREVPVILTTSGVYYDSTEDVTVELSNDSLGVNRVVQGTLHLELNYAVFEGYQIVAESIAGGFVYGVDAEALLLCEGGVSLEGTLQTTTALAVYAGSARSADGAHGVPLNALLHLEEDWILLEFGPSPHLEGSFYVPISDGCFSTTRARGVEHVLIRGVGRGHVIRGTILGADGVEEGPMEYQFEAARLVEPAAATMAGPESGAARQATVGAPRVSEESGS